jgi:metal-sulfur cluster biosynthetic enzyme
MMPTQEQVIEIIKQCYDPEIPINIYDLGLIYEIDAKPDSVGVKMTLTAAACPAAQTLPEQVRERISSALDVNNVNVAVTFEPPWTPEKISPEGRKKLGIPDFEEGESEPSI